MIRLVFFALPLLLSNEATLAAESNGNAALALAALVGEQSPTLSSNEKMVLARFLAGKTNFVQPSGVAHITVEADKITCRLSEVDIVEHSCVLTFGSKGKKESGRPAQELLATMVENGVPSDGAAGSIYYSVFSITCTVDAAAIRSKNGGGARCTYTNGQ